MLSISFGEILLIATVGLVVIGPERLPKAARFAGHLFGRVQRQIQSVKADIKREMDAADVQSIRDEYQKAAKQTGESAADIYQSIRQTASQAGADIAKVADDNKGAGGDNSGGDVASGGNDDNKTADDAKAFPPPHTAPTATNKAD